MHFPDSSRGRTVTLNSKRFHISMPAGISFSDLFACIRCIILCSLGKVELNSYFQAIHWFWCDTYADRLLAIVCRNLDNDYNVALVAHHHRPSRVCVNGRKPIIERMFLIFFIRTDSSALVQNSFISILKPKRQCQ